jgi:putative inorganic carbon (HCO3(-)) transporter
LRRSDPRRFRSRRRTWLARVVRNGRAALPRPTLVLGGLGLVVFAGLVSAIGSLAPATTAFETFRLLALFLLALVVAWRAEEPLQARRILGVLIAVAIALVGVEMIQYIAPGLGIGTIATQGLESTELLVRPAAFFLDPNFLAGYLSAASLASIAFFVRSRRVGEAVIWGLAGAITGIGTVLTYSRSGWVGLAVGLVVVVATAPRDRRKLIIIAALVLTIAVVPFLPSTVTDRVTTLINPQGQTSLSTRYLMGVSSIEMLGEYWFSGTGLGVFEVAYPPYRRPGSLPRILHPHQMPLAIWVEMGLLGLLAEFALLAGIVIAWRRVGAQGYPGVSAAVVAAVVALVVQSFFQYYLFFEYLWLFIALLAAVSAREGEARSA